VESNDLPTGRTERLIAAGRVVLAAASLFAVWLDPSEPAKYAQIAYALLVAYLVYAVAIALLLWRFDPPPRRGRLTSHLFDLVFFSLFIYFTAGAGSPFTAFFVFSLVCATLRWRWRGTAWTALASLVAVLGISFYFGEVVHDADFQLHSSIIRGVYLAVVAVLLGYLGAHEERTRREMSRLAAWTAAAEERNRLSRDLHDGVLQSFTGIALRLAAVRRRLAGAPAAAGEDLAELQRLIALEQRDLRFFIAELKPPAPGGVGEGVSLGDRLGVLAERIEREWGLRVDLRLDGMAAVPEPLGRQIYHLIREALVNAVRHGEASEVLVAVGGAADERVAITVADNGRGFPFEGRFDRDALARLDLGPKSLRERVASLEGSLVIDSSPAGARLEMVLPLSAA
jgi:signal transduction histidine kinase